MKTFLIADFDKNKLKNEKNLREFLFFIDPKSQKIENAVTQ